MFEKYYAVYFRKLENLEMLKLQQSFIINFLNIHTGI